MSTLEKALPTTDAPPKNDALRLFEAMGDIQIISIHKDEEKPPFGKYFGDNHANAVEYCAAQNLCGHNVYFTANQVRANLNKKATKSDIINARYCFADIDPKKDSTPFDKAAVLETIAALEYDPFAVIDSGNGIQVLFKLDGPHQVREPVERVNRQLIAALDADIACWNIDRILRVPGFTNHATPSKIKLGRVDCESSLIKLDTKPSYSIDELAEFLPEPIEPAVTDDAGCTEIDIDGMDGNLTLEDIGILPGTDAYAAVTAPQDPDGSNAAFAAVRHLAWAGKSDIEIGSILLNTDYPAGEHLFSLKTKRKISRALSRMITKVRDDAPYVPAADVDFVRFVQGLKDKASADKIAEQVAEILEVAANHFPAIDKELKQITVTSNDQKIRGVAANLAYASAYGDFPSDVVVTCLIERAKTLDLDIGHACEMFKAGMTFGWSHYMADQCPVEEITEILPAWQRGIENHPIGWFIDHCQRTAMFHQPLIALGAALACFGTLAGRRYSSPTNLRTNVYMVGVAASSSGKDKPLRAAGELLIAAGKPEQVGPAKLASGQAILTEVIASPNILLPLDEFGLLLQQAASKNASAHNAEIVNNLMQLYSAAQGTFTGTAKADNRTNPRIIVEQPCVSLIGVSTEGAFWDSLSSKNGLDGSLARMVVLRSENDDPDPNYEARPRDWLPQLVNCAQLISEGVGTPFPSSDGPNMKPKIHTVDYADDAAFEYWKSIVDLQTKRKRATRSEAEKSIIGRLQENAVKIALIHAIVENPTDPKLAVHNLEWGLLIAEMSVKTLLDAAKNRIADNEEEEFKNLLIRIITKAGKTGIKKTEIGKKSQQLDARRRSALLEDMVDANRIIKMPTPGSKTVTYYLAKSA